MPAPSVVPPSLNVTEPVAVELTVAVKVTELPYVDVGNDDVTLVDEAIAVIVNTPFTKLKP